MTKQELMNEIEQKKKAKEVVEKLSSFVNNMNGRPELMVAEIMREHRTLQQSMFSFFIQCIEAWSKLPDGYYDLRNEYTVTMSKTIMEAIKDRWGGGAPLI